MEEHFLSLQKNFTLPEIDSTLREASCNSVAYEWIQTINDYIVSQMGNPDQTPVYFDMQSNYTAHDIRAKSEVTKRSGNDNVSNLHAGGMCG